ncbi:MAG TPA: 2Fe-2S iron-sulfur cluster-binding protein [Spirochaetia bacterium]|nr:2Fe-2S iron-sulfur cluster-binding protein [Spirochaetia bacterium]
MALIVLSDGRRIAASPAVSILNCLLREGVRIRHVCGGKAECGTCMIRIVSGSEFLSPMQSRERERLEAKQAGPEMRLACQTYTRGEVEIEIQNI